MVIKGLTKVAAMGKKEKGKIVRNNPKANLSGLGDDLWKTIKRNELWMALRFHHKTNRVSFIKNQEINWQSER